MLNLLHLLAALAIAGCLYALRQEARGISQSRGHLMVPPPLAFGCVLLMISLTEPDLRQPDVLRLAITAGVLLGAARGLRDRRGRGRSVGIDGGIVVCAIRHYRRGIRRQLPVGPRRDGLSAHPELTFPASPPLLH
jgi:hypothetical protein